MASKKSKKNKKVSAVEAALEEEKVKAPAAAPAAPSSSKKKKKGKKAKKEPTPPPPPVESSSEEEEEDDTKLTLEALDAISDDDSDANEDEEDDGAGEEEEGEYDKEAEALRKMIQDGKFDGLLKKKKKEEKSKSSKKKKAEKEESEDDEPEEAVLDASMEEVEEESDNKEEDEGTEEENEQNNQSDSEEEKEEDQAAALAAQLKNQNNTRALALETALQVTDRHLPWAETFAVVAPTPLPFGPPDGSVAAASAGKKRQRAEEDDEEDEEEDEEEESVDVHDDLKREVAFYDNALESVLLAREKCESVGIPFTRPEDFFAEMVKGDDHMAKIKDRLIFETKRMEAVERRKSNKEQTVMAKERHAHRLSEKAKMKKAHMSAVDDWKKNAERGRSGLGGRVREDDEDQLRGMGQNNNKRMNADKKYGFGGQKSRFKQNDKQSMNDMSGYNPRGAKGLQKSQSGKGGKKRPGKRARDSKRG